MSSAATSGVSELLVTRVYWLVTSKQSIYWSRRSLWLRREVTPTRNARSGSARSRSAKLAIMPT